MVPDHPGVALPGRQCGGADEDAIGQLGSCEQIAFDPKEFGVPSG